MPCPSFRLTIEESWSEGKEMIARITATTHLDEEGQRFVAKHPLWSKDCRPFLLWQIYEAFWQLKLMEADFGAPKVFKVGLQDSKRNSLTVVTITAEVFYDGKGSPAIHLPNYANTHIYDQLAKIYETNPDARPSPDWMDQTKERILREHAKAELKITRERELRLRARPVNNDPVTLFIDETGDLGFKSGEHFYINCGVLVKDSRLDATRDAIRNVIASNWRGSVPQELHFSSMPASKFVAVSDALAEIFLREVDDAICLSAINLDFCRYLLRCEAEFNRTQERPIQTNIAELLADENSHPGRKLLILTTEELIAHIGVDCLVAGSNLSVVHDRKHRNWMNQALEKGFERSKSAIQLTSSQIYDHKLCPSMQFNRVPSETEPCLWLSDWVAWEFGAWMRGAKLSAAFEKAKRKIRFLGFGERGKKVQFDGPGGRELASYPDRPREIATIL